MEELKLIRRIHEALRRTGIKDDEISINPMNSDDKDSTFVLRKNGDKWLAYYSERGLMKRVGRFDHLVDAAEHLFGIANGRYDFISITRDIS